MSGRFDNIINVNDGSASVLSLSFLFESVIIKGSMTDLNFIVSVFDFKTWRMTNCFCLHDIDLSNNNDSSSSSSSFICKKNDITQTT